MVPKPVPEESPDVIYFPQIVDYLRELVLCGVCDAHFHPDWPPFQRNPNGFLADFEGAPARIVTEEELFKLALWVTQGTPFHQKLDYLQKRCELLKQLCAANPDLPLDSLLEEEYPAFAKVPLPETFDVGLDLKTKGENGEEGVTGRFRVQIFFTDSAKPYECGLNLAFRRILPEIPSYQDLGFNAAAGLLVNDILDRTITHGLVLVIGATGSGKSTSVAAMVDAINATLPLNIISIEDPVEYRHPPKQAYIRQISLHRNVISYPQAIRNALRQDPDIVVIQEIRDHQTAIEALKLAGANRLVFGTFHGLTDTASALLDFCKLVGDNFHAVATHLQAIVAQQLLPASDGQGRVLIQEVLRPRKNLRIRELLRSKCQDPEVYYAELGQANTSLLKYEVSTVHSLAEAVVGNKINLSVAMATASHENELREAISLLAEPAPNNAQSHNTPGFLKNRNLE